MIDETDNLNETTSATLGPIDDIIKLLKDLISKLSHGPACTCGCKISSPSNAIVTPGQVILEKTVIKPHGSDTPRNLQARLVLGTPVTVDVSAVCTATLQPGDSTDRIRLEVELNSHAAETIYLDEVTLNRHDVVNGSFEVTLCGVVSLPANLLTQEHRIRVTHETNNIYAYTSSIKVTVVSSP
ncbi:MAG: hypothetical protein QM785_05540 [Pyrinomonadaceae bacterium]